MANMRTQLRPYLRLILRTVAYSVGIGAPLFLAYFWLDRFLKFGSFPTRGLPESLFLGLIFAVVVFFLLGACVGILIALVSAICHRRISQPDRFRLLIALVVFLPSLLCFLLSLHDGNRPFRASVLNTLMVETDIIGRWLLATTIAVGICQRIADKFDREARPRKRGHQIKMWRAIPLIKMVVLVTIVCAVLPVTEQLAHEQFFAAESNASRYDSDYRLTRDLREGASTGLILGCAMALSIMLCFNDIHRRRRFRVAMFTIPLIAILVVNFWWLPMLPSYLQEGRGGLVLGWILSAVPVALNVVVCHIAAGRYLQAVTSGKAKTSEKSKTAAVSSAPPAGDRGPHAPA